MKEQPIEIELKFLVAPGAREGVLAELARGSTTQRISLAAMYLDTDDRRLARTGLAWRLRREGRRWVQTLKASSANPLERFEHDIARTSATRSPTPDASLHAGTGPGDALLELLRRAQADGFETVVRFRTEVRRTVRRVATRGAVVEVAFDEGRIVGGNGVQQPIREVEFELVSGSPAAMLALAERWRKRFGLIHDPRSKSERGDRVADGTPHPPVRKAARPNWDCDATATQAFGSVVDECMAQITRNAIGLIAGHADLRVEYVHQLRVGIRRLRSALRTFRGWVPVPPDDLLEGLRSLFAELGVARDADVLGGGVAAELVAAGAPALALPPGPSGVDPGAAVGADETQRMLLAWLAWRTSLAAPASSAHDANAAKSPAESDNGAARAADHPDVHHPPEPDAAAHPLRRNAASRLRRWHKALAADSKAFDDLDDAALHALRKRIKRQRYAVEFLAPALRRREVERYLEALAAIQDRMGALNDLFVARARYQTMATTDPAAWFALGWLAARIAELRALAKPELARLAKTDPPTPRGGEP